ncbi:unnamed protein product [Paramecium pentaurelia]|uniref:Uncharacterized protein n=1 Tax=Paramecium pentaurelia TaxID=43138 RepID=A0A8S1VRY4_9CILI|nr:unnamed protein product [Paramecium pentaurelia]
MSKTKQQGKLILSHLNQLWNKEQSKGRVWSKLTTNKTVLTSGQPVSFKEKKQLKKKFRQHYQHRISWILELLKQHAMLKVNFMKLRADSQVRISEIFTESEYSYTGIPNSWFKLIGLGSWKIEWYMQNNNVDWSFLQLQGEHPLQVKFDASNLQFYSSGAIYNYANYFALIIGYDLYLK